MLETKRQNLKIVHNITEDSVATSMLVQDFGDEMYNTFWWQVWYTVCIANIGGRFDYFGHQYPIFFL